MSFHSILESKNLSLLPMRYFADYQTEHVNETFSVYPAVVLYHSYICTIYTTQLESVYLVHMACI